MDLRDWPDSEVDGCIRASLRTGVVITDQQKQHAWEQLRLKAAQQPMLPPLSHATQTFTPRRTPMREMILRPLRGAVAWIDDLLYDEGQYARASRVRRGLLLHEIYQPYANFRLTA
jgi:hypothetical protein